MFGNYIMSPLNLWNAAHKTSTDNSVYIESHMELYMYSVQHSVVIFFF